MFKPVYSIITVTWKSKDDVVRLIESLYAHIKESFEIIVVDNNSQDDVADILAEKFPEVIVIENKENKGYAGGMTQGYHVASGEHLIFMNPDMVMHEDSLSILKKKLIENQHIGIIAPQLRYEDNEIQPTIKNAPSLRSQILILLKLHHFIKTRSLKEYLNTSFDYTQEQCVHSLMGAFIMCTRGRYEAFGGWDLDYPLWWEDEQLCRDSLKKGFVNVYTPDTWITHFEGKSFAQVLPIHKQKRFNKGMRIYFLKNKGIFAYVLLLALHPVSMLLARIVQLLKVAPRSQSKVTKS
jgi:GT2 family glycosyltransferase